MLTHRRIELKVGGGDVEVPRRDAVGAPSGLEQPQVAVRGSDGCREVARQLGVPVEHRVPIYRPRLRRCISHGAEGKQRRSL